MNRFEIRTVCVNLIEHLNKTLGQRNLLKLNIDVKLPIAYYDQPENLTEPIEKISGYMSQVMVNGVITINIQKWHEQDSDITLLIQVSGSGVPNISAEITGNLSSRLREVSEEYRKFIFDLVDNYDDNTLTCVYKINLRNAPLNFTVESRKLPFESKKILIAEDNEINALVFSSFLEEWGCESIIASNGSEAIELLKSVSVDLILMDLYMPVMNGIDAIREIRKTDTAMPIISLTASTLETDISQAWEAGSNDLLFKPVSSGTLFQVLSKYL